MKRQLTILTLLLALLVGVTIAPAVSTSVSAASAGSHAAVVQVNAHPAAFDKTKFVIHLGIAAFLIHYIYKKYKEGKFGHFHLITDLKAVAAALIGIHELKVAYSDAKNSNSKTLHLLIAPINGLINGFTTMESKLKHGDTSAISGLNSQEGSFASLASKNSFSFKDVAPPAFSNF